MSTAVPTGYAPDPTLADRLRPNAVAQFMALSKRSLAGSVRQLPLLLPSLIFPLFFVAINTSSFHKSLPLLRANAAAQRRMWEESCARAGGAVFSQPADLTNPLVVHTGHPLDECRSATGVLVSTRD